MSSRTRVIDAFLAVAVAGILLVLLDLGIVALIAGLVVLVAAVSFAVERVARRRRRSADDGR